jgi:hypothetical protein
MSAQTAAFCLSLWKYSKTPLIRTLVIQIANYPDRLGSFGKYFLTVIALHLFMALIPPQFSNTN